MPLICTAMPSLPSFSQSSAPSGRAGTGSGVAAATCARESVALRGEGTKRASLTPRALHQRSISK